VRISYAKLFWSSCKCKTQSICGGHYENLEYITKEGEIIKNLNKGEFYKYLGINHIQHSIIKENLEKQFYLRMKSLLKSKLNGNNLIKAVNTYAVPLLTYSFGVIKWSKTNLQNINVKTRVLFTLDNMSCETSVTCCFFYFGFINLFFFNIK
jgi:hypothetical protein